MRIQRFKHLQTRQGLFELPPSLGFSPLVWQLLCNPLIYLLLGKVLGKFLVRIALP